MPELTPRGRARAGLAALDVLEAVTTGGDMDHSGRVGRAMAAVALEDLDPGEQAALVACLAVMAAYGVPTPVRERGVVSRMAALRAWLPKPRLEWTWSAS